MSWVTVIMRHDQMARSMPLSTCPWLAHFPEIWEFPEGRSEVTFDIVSRSKHCI